MKENFQSNLSRDLTLIFNSGKNPYFGNYVEKHKLRLGATFMREGKNAQKTIKTF